MNNADFRKFVADTPRQQSNGSPDTSRRPNRSTASLGSKARSAIPMTPRSVKNAQQVNFARQLAEQRSGAQPQKKPRSTGPRGTKLSEGYVDRAQARRDAQQNDGEDDQDQDEERIRELEAKLEQGQLDDADIKELRALVTHRKPKVKHAVRGLDMSLVEPSSGLETEKDTEGEDQHHEKVEEKEELDDEKAFEELEQQDIKPVFRDESAKKGEMPSPPKPVAGTKRSRNDILAELRASRQGASGGKPSRSTPGFHKITAKTENGPKIEIDEKGREVLITVDENGRVKRKVRKVARKPGPRTEETPTQAEANVENTSAASPPEPNGQRTSDTASSLPGQPEDDGDDDDDDIFADVGDDYDPLKDLRGDEESDADSAVESGDEAPDTRKAKPDGGALTAAEADAVAMPPPPKPHVKRNYFGTTGSAAEDDSTKKPNRNTPFSDPAILAAFKRASKIELSSEDSEEQPKAKAPSTAAERLLGPQHDRDFDDLDMGFGASRGGDDLDVDEDSGRMRLSEWRGLDGDEDGDEEGTSKGGAKKRQRSRKKRKGDKDSAADVLGVIEGRK